jgi:hypothetical protein
MLKAPRGEKRSADVIGNAVRVIRMWSMEAAASQRLTARLIRHR